MVLLHVKKGDRDLFLFETDLKYLISELVKDLVFIHNGQLRIERLCYGKMLFKANIFILKLLFTLIASKISLRGCYFP